MPLASSACSRARGAGPAIRDDDGCRRSAAPRRRRCFRQPANGGEAEGGVDPRTPRKRTFIARLLQTCSPRISRARKSSRARRRSRTLDREEARAVPLPQSVPSAPAFALHGDERRFRVERAPAPGAVFVGIGFPRIALRDSRPTQSIDVLSLKEAQARITERIFVGGELEYTIVTGVNDGGGGTPNSFGLYATGVRRLHRRRRKARGLRAQRPPFSLPGPGRIIFRPSRKGSRYKEPP